MQNQGDSPAHTSGETALFQQGTSSQGSAPGTPGQLELEEMQQEEEVPVPVFDLGVTLNEIATRIGNIQNAVFQANQITHQNIHELLLQITLAGQAQDLHTIIDPSGGLFDGQNPPLAQEIINALPQQETGNQPEDNQEIQQENAEPIAQNSQCSKCNVF